MASLLSRRATPSVWQVKAAHVSLVPSWSAASSSRLSPYHAAACLKTKDVQSTLRRNYYCKRASPRHSSKLTSWTRLRSRPVSNESRSPDEPRPASTSSSSGKTENEKPLKRSIENAKERTKAVREKVRSSLTNLTPRENIYNLPNFLTVSRLIAAPVTAYFLVHDHYKWALGLFAYAGFTDLVDGWLARKWKLQTVAGSVIDPMADKALMIILTVTLAIKGALPAYLATLILGRDASLAIAAIYYRYASLPAPKTMGRYWDFSLPSAEVHPTTVSKYNTFLKLVLIGSALALPVVTAGGEYAGLLHGLGLTDAALNSSMHYYQWLVAATTAWSGLSYAYLKDAVTIIGTDEALKAKQGARGRAIIGVTFGSMVAVATWLAFTVDEERKQEQKEQSEIQRPQ
ncbi:hypothetical protein KC318_g15235 [Hortaea werneckii]|uniref:Uncharacterized protein n=1 Tax=Hortaea werneckii TaxID=91943 RepID=A0A3M6ZWK1_HORWE|nr:hypothetical protein KC334_g15358 [Hortaea werneckii]KAI6996222.1 hypothetical protein KC355_g10218 [Hortaea werneckii]KAI7652076.1 hypothetical protein KC318_g15235 [Hortaea werneckii]RMX94692.1 hypothetical protein D0867_13760 [Hortaea werneckii]RMY19537.1 hypothetical protein D0866_12811 [Hortaea werneckii]